MNFAENLKRIRKERHLSQEELAEMMDVSRQSVSKWEQGQGYPEVEKLLELSRELQVSLDALMGTEVSEADEETKESFKGAIVITSPNENVIANCYKVAASRKIRGGKRSPQYALFGVDRGGSSYWGEPTAFLGWYANGEMLSKEMEAIHEAIRKGTPTYTLQYSAKTERRWGSIKIVEE